MSSTSMSFFPGWISADSSNTTATPEQFLEVTDLLLENVQLNSTHLFRADILYDSKGKLRTVTEKEYYYGSIQEKLPSLPSQSDNCNPAHLEGIVTKCPPESGRENYHCCSQIEIVQYPTFEGFNHHRTVLRRLIPRKPQLDEALEQSCFIYLNTVEVGVPNIREILVVYMPHCSNPDSMPWYHPKVRGVAYKYSQFDTGPELSVHYLPFPNLPIADRVKRTMQSLLKTSVRLLKMPSRIPHTDELSSDMSRISLAAASLKDTILPQHVVQNTYTRLKQAYAPDLIARWVESTEPSKHVFEDLAIAAFLIELWNSMYKQSDSSGCHQSYKNKFPGFVDIACGNGVLTYILTKEGWQGRGFDARRRKTWDIFDINCLDEAVCIPQPFLDQFDSDLALSALNIHNGIFSEGTFIISNHADELTCWTPILAALSQPPHPFLAIPCCSHALDGSKHRYTLKEVAGASSSTEAYRYRGQDADDDVARADSQSQTGDLKALRTQKQAAHSHSDPGDKSMYGCLTRKTAALAKELESEVELTLMRIPSTRNIGVVGNRNSVGTPSNTDMSALIQTVLERECALTGGLQKSAQTWVEKARKLQEGQGRGKVNWNGPQPQM